jgi:hypothetical protein
MKTAEFDVMRCSSIFVGAASCRDGQGWKPPTILSRADSAVRFYLPSERWAAAHHPFLKTFEVPL